MDLNIILKELEQYKNIDREELLVNYIQKRLTTSLSTYYKELDKSLVSLYEKNDLKVLKSINKGCTN